MPLPAHHFTTDQVAGTVGILGGVCTAAAFIVRITLGRRLNDIEGRLDKHDGDLAQVTETTTATRVAVARIEGYMAARNGGGEKLPANPVSARIAREQASPDLLEQLPEKDYPLDEAGDD